MLPQLQRLQSVDWLGKIILSVEKQYLEGEHRLLFYGTIRNSHGGTENYRERPHSVHSVSGLKFKSGFVLKWSSSNHYTTMFDMIPLSQIQNLLNILNGDSVSPTSEVRSATILALLAAEARTEFVFFWIVAPCIVVVGCQRFGESYCLHLQGSTRRINTTSSKGCH